MPRFSIQGENSKTYVLDKNATSKLMKSGDPKWKKKYF